MPGRGQRRQPESDGGRSGDFVTSGRPVFVGLPNIAVVGSVASNIIPTPNFSTRYSTVLCAALNK